MIQLKHAILTLPAEQAHDIKQAYYKACEGLAALAEALEAVDGLETCDPLAKEYGHACVALESMNRSELGKVL